MTRYVITTINRCLDFLLHCYTLPLLSLVNSNCSFRNCQTTSQASSGDMDTGQGEERRINIENISCPRVGLICWWRRNNFLVELHGFDSILYWQEIRLNDILFQLTDRYHGIGELQMSDTLWVHHVNKGTTFALNKIPSLVPSKSVVFYPGLTLSWVESDILTFKM